MSRLLQAYFFRLPQLPGNEAPPNSQSRLSVATEIPSTEAASASVSPPK